VVNPPPAALASFLFAFDVYTLAPPVGPSASASRDKNTKLALNISRIFPPCPWITSPTRGDSQIFSSLTNKHPSRGDCGDAEVFSVSRSNNHYILTFLP
ncbi:AAEL017406-PA, partial [Aedes aegypti]